MALSAGKIIAVVIALLLIGILLPIGIGTAPVEGVSNGTGLLGVSSGNATIDLLIPTVGIMAVIGLMLAFIPRGKSD